MTTSRVLGLDAARCGSRNGWVGVVLRQGTFDEAAFVEDVSAALTRWDDVAVVGVDIPIGLPTVGSYPRAADVEARAYVAASRRSSVFPTPPREVLEAEDYPTANASMKSRLDRGLSVQSYSLRAKVLEVDACGDDRLHEVHPEVAFQAIAGRGLVYPKRSWNGQRERLELLRQAGIELPMELPDIERVPADDLLDAAIVAWTAHCIAAGRVASFPEERAADTPTIWYPADG